MSAVLSDTGIRPANNIVRLPVAAFDHLDWLESEAIHIMREVVGETRNPALLFSGGMILGQDDDGGANG
jgi:3'-phosphoadenosine 5'-phosphosulfate sulfotransferase (PAPS reductase)/FAD synthetase